MANGFALSVEKIPQGNMKSKFVGWALSALFVVAVVWLAFRITAVRNFILGTSAAPQ